MKPEEIKKTLDFYHKKQKEQAEKYIERIEIAIYNVRRYEPIRKPSIFMSHDIMATIEKGTDSVLIRHKSGITEICGCKLKVVLGTDELNIGFDI